MTYADMAQCPACKRQALRRGDGSFACADGHDRCEWWVTEVNSMRYRVAYTALYAAVVIGTIAAVLYANGEHVTPSVALLFLGAGFFIRAVWADSEHHVPDEVWRGED